MVMATAAARSASTNLSSTSCDSSPGIERALAEGLRGVRDAFHGRHHAHEERDDHVDAHAVLGEQGVLAGAGDFQLQRVHVHEDDVVNDAEDDGTAVHHDLSGPPRPVRTNERSFDERRYRRAKMKRTDQQRHEADADHRLPCSETRLCPSPNIDAPSGATADRVADWGSPRTECLISGARAARSCRSRNVPPVSGSTMTYSVWPCWFTTLACAG